MAESVVHSKASQSSVNTESITEDQDHMFYHNFNLGNLAVFCRHNGEFVSPLNESSMLLIERNQVD